MKTTWRFNNLASLADYLENKARDKRASAAERKLKSVKAIQLIAEAAENEALAYLIRNCEITNK